MKEKLTLVCSIAFALASVILVACSGDVTVHGIPESIALETPICFPTKDAGTAAKPNTDASDD